MYRFHIPEMIRIRLPELDRWQLGLIIYTTLTALKMVLDHMSGASVTVPLELLGL